MILWNKIERCLERLGLKIYSFRTRHRFKKVGDDISFNGKITIVDPQNIQIGNRCSLNHGIYLNALNPIVIGDDVTISANVNIVSSGIEYQKWFETGKKEHIRNDGIVIGNHVWIGCGATILEGVHITGEYVIIAANAVVTKDITENYCVVFGCPAKIKKVINN